MNKSWSLTTAPAVETVGLTCRRGSVVALDAVDLRVDRGEVFALLGHNGAGKSTFVRVLCGLLRPTAGRAEVAGFDVVSGSWEVRRRIGVALQDVGLDDLQTGWELLATQARLHRLRGRVARRRVAEVAEISGLGEALGRAVRTYSGGMKRRLDLAAALVNRPEVLFLDEPTTGLDPPSRRRVWDEVRQLHDEAGVTVILTTQYLEEADALADRVAILRRGRIVADGPPEDLKRATAPDVVIVRVHGDTDAAVAVLRNMSSLIEVVHRGDHIEATTAEARSAVGPVAVALDRAGIAASSIDVKRATLDDVFARFAAPVAP